MFHLNPALPHPIFNTELYAPEMPLSTGKTNGVLLLLFCFSPKNNIWGQESKKCTYENTRTQYI